MIKSLGISVNKTCYGNLKLSLVAQPSLVCLMRKKQEMRLEK